MKKNKNVRNRNSLIRSIVIILVLAAGMLAACGGNHQGGDNPPANDNRDKVVFALDWTPNTNHSGLFLAKDKGYYAAESMEVDFQESDMNFIEMVANGTAAFGIAAQEQVLQARASDAKIPIVAIAAILQHNTSGFASPEARGIRSPKDFEGKTYSGWGTELELAIMKTLMQKEGADFSKVKIINQSASNFMASMETEADFAWIYYGWDGVSCETSGFGINFILLQDIDERLDFYSPLIITNEKTIEENPDLVRRFLRATAKGYTLAISDPEAAVESLMKVAPELDRKLVAESQKYLNQRYMSDAPRWGDMKSRVWEGFAAWMEEHGLLNHRIDPADAFDTSFLP